MAERPGRQTNGRSSIYQGADGYWHGRVTVGSKVDGRPDRRHVMAKSRAEATRKVRDLEEARRAGRVGSPGQMRTLEQWLTHWIDHVVEGRVRRKSHAAYQSAVRKHLVPGLGKNRLDKLTPETIERFYRELAAEIVEKPDGSVRRRYRPATIEQIHRTLRTALQDALRRGVVTSNVAALATRPNLQGADDADREIEPFSLDEARAILRAAEAMPNGQRAVIALSAGLRQGEAIGLTWDRVDIDGEFPAIRVRFQLQRHTWRHGCGLRADDGSYPCRARRGADCPMRHSGGLVLTEVKSASGRRTVALDVVTAAALREHRARQQRTFDAVGRRWDATDYVFTTPAGDPIDPRQDLREWKALLVAAGVREGRLHDARHTAASFLLVQGVDPRVVMDLMGWSTVTMLKRYQHVIDALRRDAANRVGALLHGTSDVSNRDAGG